jgi:hypothetical protein
MQDDGHPFAMKRWRSIAAREKRESGAFFSRSGRHDSNHRQLLRVTHARNEMMVESCTGSRIPSIPGDSRKLDQRPDQQRDIQQYRYPAWNGYSNNLPAPAGRAATRGCDMCRRATPNRRFSNGKGEWQTHTQ